MTWADDESLSLSLSLSLSVRRLQQRLSEKPVGTELKFPCRHSGDKPACSVSPGLAPFASALFAFRQSRESLARAARALRLAVVTNCPHEEKELITRVRGRGVYRQFPNSTRHVLSAEGVTCSSGSRHALRTRRDGIMRDYCFSD